MSVQPVPRCADEALLQMLVLRCAGHSSRDVGDRLGVSSHAVRVATNRVIAADLLESGEPARDVLAAYQWGRG